MKDELRLLIGQRIKSLLSKNKETQKELAAVLSVTENRISYYVNGKRTPNIEKLIMISDHYNTAIDYLLGKTDNMELQYSGGDNAHFADVDKMALKLQYSGGDNALDCQIKAETIRARLSLEDQLLQLAEECGELSAAVLKLVRIRRDKSPTPITEIEALGRIEEELTDVRVCLDVIGDQIWRSDLYAYKMSRWYDRLKERRCRKNESQTEKDSGKDQSSDTVGENSPGAEL